MWKPCCDPNIYNLQITSRSIWFLPPKRLTFNQQQLNYFSFLSKGRIETLTPSLNESPDKKHAGDDKGGGGSFNMASIAHSRLAHVQDQETQAQWCHESRPPDPRVTGLERVLVHCPQAKVKYVNVVHVDFIWSSMISSQTLNCDPPPWETHPGQETVCFR